MSRTKKRLPIMGHCASRQGLGLGVNLHIRVRRSCGWLDRGEFLNARRGGIGKNSRLSLRRSLLGGSHRASERQYKTRNTYKEVTQIASRNHFSQHGLEFAERRCLAALILMAKAGKTKNQLAGPKNSIGQVMARMNSLESRGLTGIAPNGGAQYENRLK